MSVQAAFAFPPAYIEGVFMGRVAPLGPEAVPSAFVKSRVSAAIRATTMGLRGDEQADLVNHGGVDKAVYAYPTLHYARWKALFPQLATLWAPGAVGENLTIDGCSEGDVCIGDVYRIGAALVQVTQPRKPCFKLALRFDLSTLPAELVARGWSGWYFRVLEEGDIAAGDVLALQERLHASWTIRRVNAVSYGAGEVSELRELASVPKLSAAWREQVTSALATARSRKAASAFHMHRVDEVNDESTTMRSFVLRPVGGPAFAKHRAGQYVVVQVPDEDGDTPRLRPFTISSSARRPAYRLSVRRGPPGSATSWMHDRLAPGDTIAVSAPRGRFVLDPHDERPLVLISAGSGITPVLAMLDEATSDPGRGPSAIRFLHGARNGQELAFLEEFREMASRSPGRVVTFIRMSAPDASDRTLAEFDGAGRWTEPALLARIEGLDGYVACVCGPEDFLSDVSRWLTSAAHPPAAILSESFEGGIDGPSVAGAEVSEADIVLARTGRALKWSAFAGRSLLQVASDAGLIVDSDCRVGVCGRCATRLISGSVTYASAPTAFAEVDEILMCCARPASRSVVLDL